MRRVRSRRVRKKRFPRKRINWRSVRRWRRLRRLARRRLARRRLARRRLAKRRLRRRSLRLGRLGPYRYNRRPIGKGMYGSVYQGYHIRTRKRVVIKISPKVRKARQEYAILRRANRHRFIARGIRIFLRNKRAYIVMERAAGKPLAKRRRYIWIGKRRRLKQAAIITIRTLQTVSYLQRKGIYHHDIGPTNIVARRNPINIKMVDFGSARIHRRRPPYNSDVARSAFLMYFLLKGRVRLDTLIRKKLYPAIRVRPLRLQRILRKAMHPRKQFRYKKPSTLIKLLRPYAK